MLEFNLTRSEGKHKLQIIPPNLSKYRFSNEGTESRKTSAVKDGTIPFVFCMERLDPHWGRRSVAVHLSSVFKALGSILNSMKEMKKRSKRVCQGSRREGKQNTKHGVYCEIYPIYKWNTLRILWERKQTIQADGIISGVIQPKKSIFLSVMKPYKRGIYQSGQRC